MAKKANYRFRPVIEKYSGKQFKSMGDAAKYFKISLSTVSKSVSEGKQVKHNTLKFFLCDILEL